MSKTVLTINAIKDEGTDPTTNGYVLYTCAYVKEYPAINIQVESWKEDDIKQEAKEFYEGVMMDLKDHYPDAPEKVDDFEIVWFDDLKKWLHDN